MAQILLLLQIILNILNNTLGKRNILWDTKSINTRNNNWQTMKKFIANQDANNLPYRLSLFVQSYSSNTYIGVRSIHYTTTDLYINCGGHPIQSNTGTITTKQQIQPTISPSKSLFCDFEHNDLCNWRSPSNTFIVGTPLSSTIPNTATLYLPPYDNTKKSRTGHLVYTYGYQLYFATLEADNPYINSIQFNNPTYNEICFQFYYYFYAAAISNFKLVMSDNINQQHSTQTTSSKIITVFQAYTANEINWKLARFTISLNATTKFNKFKFISQIKMGKKKKKSIAKSQYFKQNFLLRYLSA